MSSIWSDPVFDREFACAIACAGVTLSSLEWLVPPAKLGAECLFDSPHLRSASLARLWQPLVLRMILVLRLTCALTFLLSIVSRALGFLSGGSVLAAGLLCLPLRLRSPFGVLPGLDGAEHLFPPILLALGASFFFESTIVLEAALVFVAVQVSLEYGGAGWSKFANRRSWMQGSSLLQALSSSNYGHPRAAAFIRSHPVTAGLLSSGVIVIEMAAPCALVLPTPLAELLLLGVFTFHLGAAAVMGLNTFLWAFPATYPAILYCRDLLRSL